MIVKSSRKVFSENKQAMQSNVAHRAVAWACFTLALASVQAHAREGSSKRTSSTNSARKQEVPKSRSKQTGLCPASMVTGRPEFLPFNGKDRNQRPQPLISSTQSFGVHILHTASRRRESRRQAGCRGKAAASSYSISHKHSSDTGSPA